MAGMTDKLFYIRNQPDWWNFMKQAEGLSKIKTSDQDAETCLLTGFVGTNDH